jgi:hypothetical protein
MGGPVPPGDVLGGDRRQVLGMMMTAAGVAALPEISMATDASAAPARPERVYIHETFNISVSRRRDYLDFMCSHAVAANKARGKSRSFGVWATNGSTHRWAEAIQMWERPGVEALAVGWKHEFSYLYSADRSQDPGKNYWGSAPEGVVDTNGMDRLLVPTDYSPTLEELVAAGVKGEGYLQQAITTPAGGVHDFLQRFEAEALPATRRLGLKFVGAYRTLLVSDSEGLVLWALPRWQDWAAYERARLIDPATLDWMADCGRRGVTWDGKILVGANCNALDTGLI